MPKRSMRIYKSEEDCFVNVSPICVGSLCRKKYVRVYFTNCGTSPHLQQIECARRLDCGEIILFDHIVSAACNRWNELADKINRPNEIIFEKVHDHGEMIEKIRHVTLYVHRNIGDPMGLRIGVQANWVIDEEHGFGLLYENGRIIDIGHADIAFMDRSDAYIGINDAEAMIKDYQRFIAQQKEAIEGIPSFLKLQMRMGVPDNKKITGESLFKEYNYEIERFKQCIAEIEGKMSDVGPDGLIKF